ALLSVTCELVPVGEELLLKMAHEPVYRTGLSAPDFGEGFKAAVRAWVAARLRAALSYSNALPTEAALFGEIAPKSTLDAAADEAQRRQRPILAFVYDADQPKRGKLQWSLSYFLQNKRTRTRMNEAFVTALV